MVGSSTGHLGEDVLRKAGKAFKEMGQGRAGNGVSVYLACVIGRKAMSKPSEARIQKDPLGQCSWPLL